MTPNWLPQQPWMQMPQAKQGKSTGQGIIEGAASIGTALLNRGSDDPVAPPVNVQADQTAPAPVDPPIPIAPVPEYGARPVAEENPLLKRKAAILGMLGGGGYGL